MSKVSEAALRCQEYETKRLALALEYDDAYSFVYPQVPGGQIQIVNYTGHLHIMKDYRFSPTEAVAFAKWILAQYED